MKKFELIFFLVSALLTISCQQEKELLNDPREAGELRDATTSREILEKAIDMANLLLSKQEDYFITPSWKPSDSIQSNSNNVITVFLLRPKRYFPTFDYEKSLIDSFALALENVQLDSTLSNCADTDECVHDMYKDSNIGTVVAQILNQHSTLQIANTNPKRKYIAFLDGDLQKFQFLFERGMIGKNRLPNFENFLTIILLHEVGHLNQSFTLDSLNLPEEAKIAYDKYLSLLNESKREEARADAFAAKLIREVVLNSNNLTREEKEIAYFIPIQSLLAYVYFLFDKSEGGICRHYFDQTNKHPNFELRYLAMSLILMPNSQPNINLLNNFIDKREAIASKPYATKNPDCTCLYQ